jgi:hypothetical protein
MYIQPYSSDFFSARYNDRKQKLQDQLLSLVKLYELTLADFPKDLAAFQEEMKNTPLEDWTKESTSEVVRKFVEWIDSGLV